MTRAQAYTIGLCNSFTADPTCRYAYSLPLTPAFNCFKKLTLPHFHRATKSLSAFCEALAPRTNPFP